MDQYQVKSLLRYFSVSHCSVCHVSVNCQTSNICTDSLFWSKLTSPSCAKSCYWQLKLRGRHQMSLLALFYFSKWRTSVRSISVVHIGETTNIVIMLWTCEKVISNKMLICWNTVAASKWECSFEMLSHVYTVVIIIFHSRNHRRTFLNCKTSLCEHWLCYYGRLKMELHCNQIRCSIQTWTKARQFIYKAHFIHNGNSMFFTA